MGLSNDLISQFVKVTNDKPESKKESTVYGSAKIINGKTYVQIDGSKLYTPVSTSASVKDGERVSVLITNHTATINGNMSSPSASSTDLGATNQQVSEVKMVVAHEVNAEDVNAINGNFNNLTAITGKYTNLGAITAEIENLRAEFIEGKTLKVEDIEAITAEIEYIESEFGKFEEIEVKDLTALNAAITNLKSYVGEFTYLSAVKADIKDLNVKKLSAEDADIKYANIDFSNIGTAAIEELFAKSGIIEDLVVGDSSITGTLVGVTIKGDLIEGGTVVADKLVVKGNNGLYYKLNFESDNFTNAEEVPTDGLHGSVIVAKSITAEQINVHDLVAFDATIGGFHISDEAIYSGVKESIDNTTLGIYLDSDGQMSIGDGNNYIKYYKSADEGHKLNIAVDNIQINGKGGVSDLLDCIRINPNEPSIVIGAGKNTMSLSLRNDTISFEKDGHQFGWWDGVNFHTGNIVIDVTERAQFGNFAMLPRSDGSLSFLKVTNNVGFYAYVGSGIMTLYGSYPVLEANTLAINDVSGELDGTTLILGGE